MCDVFTANNQTETNAVKHSMGYDYCKNQCLWGNKMLFIEGYHSDKQRTLKSGVLNHPVQHTTHILDNTTTGDDFWVTRLTCNYGVNFRNRFDCWSQWPSAQSVIVIMACLLIWIWISWKFIHYQMLVSNGQVPSLNISFLKFFSSFVSVENVQDWAAIFIQCLDCLNIEKWVNNLNHVQADQIILNACQFFQLHWWIEYKCDE